MVQKCDPLKLKKTLFFLFRFYIRLMLGNNKLNTTYASARIYGVLINSNTKLRLRLYCEYFYELRFLKNN